VRTSPTQRGRQIAAISASTAVRSRRVLPRASFACNSARPRRALARVWSNPRDCLSCRVGECVDIPHAGIPVVVNRALAGFGTRSAQTWDNCNLVLDEVNGGHAIERHVGQSDSFLVGRKIPAASTFPDLASAKLAATSNLNENWGAVQWWLRNGTSNRMTINGDMPSGASGRVYLKGSQTFVPARGVATVLERNASMPGGFLIFTNFATL
jgi:hypothetical protein